MEKETVQDDFYKSGPEPKAAPVKPKRRRRSSGGGQFDQEKVRRPRAKNRGANRVLRKLRRQEEFRMKILWVLIGSLVLGILIYALMDHLKWSRIEKLPPDERAAAMAELVEKNRAK